MRWPSSSCWSAMAVSVLVHELGTTSMGAVGASVSPSPATSAPPPQPLLCVRLSDFGSAKVQASFTGQLGSTLRGLSAAGGTLRWSAPEQLMDDADGLQTMAAGSSTDAELSPAGSAASSSLHSTSSTASPPSSPEDRSADVYSLGLLLAELFTSLPPYAHLPDAKVHHAIYTRQPPYSDALLDAVSSALTRLVQACSRPVGQRATMTQLKYQLWPDVQAELSGWQRRAAHVPAAAAPPPLPVHVAVAPPPGSWPSGSSATVEAEMRAKTPPIPARPTAVLSAASPSAAVNVGDPFRDFFFDAQRRGVEMAVPSPAAPLDINDPFADFFAATEQQRATAPIPATPSVPPAPTATKPGPAPATLSIIDGGNGALQLQYHHDGDEYGLFHHLEHAVALGPGRTRAQPASSPSPAPLSPASRGAALRWLAAAMGRATPRTSVMRGFASTCTLPASNCLTTLSNPPTIKSRGIGGWRAAWTDSSGTCWTCTAATTRCTRARRAGTRGMCRSSQAGRAGGIATSACSRPAPPAAALMC